MDDGVTLVDLPGANTVFVRGECGLQDIAVFLEKAYAETSELVGRQGLQFAGPPFARYEMRDQGWVVEAGFPVRGEPVAQGRVEVGRLPSGQAARIVHHGPYEEVGTAYQAVERWLVGHGYVPVDAAWESYLDEPGVADPRTEVLMPCRPVAGES